MSMQARTIGKSLLCVAVGLTLVHVVCMVVWYKGVYPFDRWAYVAMFDLDREQSFGTWFSTMILIFASLLTLFHARNSGSTSGRMHIYWWLLGIGFILLSMDEVVGLHETVNAVIRDSRWTTFGAILVLSMGVCFLPLLLILPTRTRLLFLMAGVVYAGGAVGIEWLTWWHEDNNQLDTLAYTLWTALEEFMEMTGIILYIYALLAHIADIREETRLQLDFRPPSVS
mgnify:FL=1